ncbi:MAG: amylo-alpha-1,6-glucosidase [Chloroflexi bacterium]|nr:amylo-alpha-1,6-glucosidase [Chloroflexota bacterium]
MSEAVQRATDLTGTLILKHDHLFLLSDPFGDVRSDQRGLGLYLGDTRMLSRYQLRIDGQRPVVLRTGGGASYRNTIQMTNPDLVRNPLEKSDPVAVLQRQSLGIIRERLITDAFEERIRVHNYTLHPERCRLTLGLDADFADIFEVRGVARQARGTRTAPRLVEDLVGFGYEGLDGRSRQTWVRVSEAGVRTIDDPDDAASGVTLTIDWEIPPGGDRSIEVRVSGEVLEPEDRRTRTRPGTAIAGEDPEAAHRAWHATSASISSSHAATDRAFRRSMSDLRLLVDPGPLPGERYIAAGVPWYDTLFGRDAIITALQLLMVRPQVARETLTVLARLQAVAIDDWRDAQPGKILHELRSGEMALAHEIPHTPYYGSVDATPLWLVLLGAYERWTGDLDLVDRLWPNALAALDWIDRSSDGNGFVAYHRRSDQGLINQGWKDSADAIRWADGRLAEGPIALVEVQGYVHEGRREMARLARRRGEVELAERLEAAADRLRSAFEAAYWLEDAGTYAVALDGAGRPVDSVTSNPGHALWSGLCDPQRASRVAERLLGPTMFSGWGVRTLAADMAGYNPISYHIGSIWPHDNAICAAGLWRYGFHEQASQVAAALIESTQYFRDARLPELFCGFDRTSSPYPVPYPVACSPQAWAAGSAFLLLQAMLGLQPDAAAHELRLLSPTLPAWLPDVRLENLVVGDAVVDLLVRRTDGSTGVEVLRRSGPLDVVVRV